MDNEKTKLVVFDFDGTLYDTDSSMDFFLSNFLHGKVKFHRLLRLVTASIKLIFGRISLESYKSVFFSFVRDIADLQTELKLFWNHHSRKLNLSLLDYAKSLSGIPLENFLIISASPFFLLSPASEMLGIKHLISTEFDTGTGLVIGRNCKGSEKVSRLRDAFPKSEIELFFTDSVADSPLITLSHHAYFVNHRKIKKLK